MRKLYMKSALVAFIALSALVAVMMSPDVRPTEAAPERWPGNIVPYYIDDHVSPDHKQGIKDAIEKWENRTAIRFQKLTAAELDDADRPAYLHYIDRGTKYHSYKYSDIEDDGDLDAFPNLRPGDWVIKFVDCGGASNPCRPPNEPWGSKTHIPKHETGHVLGLPHEANRSDRSETVRYFRCCVDDSPESFDKEVQHVEALKPYDIDSVMQYGSTTHCKKTDGKCVCLPLLEKTTTTYSPDPSLVHGDQLTRASGEPLSSCDVDDDVKGRVIDPPGGISKEDVNTIYQMYPPKLGASEQGDHFGEAMAQGDFDGDGYADLAVGAPDEAPGDDPGSGAVFLFKGTFTGLVSWRTLTQTGLGVNQSGDRFGNALAAGDLNADGRDELIVGAPGERVQGEKGGAAFVFLGSQTGPTTVNGYLLHQDNIGFSGGSNDDDLFGASLAVGNFNGDSRADLAIGAPGKNPGGRVFVLIWDKDRPTGDKLVKFDRVGSQRVAGDLFGTAIIAVDVNDDNFDDLVVGAPGTNGTGSIFVFPGATSKLHDAAHIKQPEGAPREQGDDFGAALAAGHFAGGNRTQIVVGAPGKKGTGWIFVMRLLYQGRNFDGVGLWDAYTQGSLAVGEPNDHFGQVFAVADFDRDGKDDLAVGIPLKNGYVVNSDGLIVVINAGAVALFRGNTNDEYLTEWAFYTQPLSYAPNRSLDRFGAAVAAANFNRKPSIPDLAIGVPGKGTDSVLESGAMFVARGQESEGVPPALSTQRNPTTAVLPPNTSFWTYFDQELAERR